jgi:uncharacterized protein YpuA (DUF1002 family)
MRKRNVFTALLCSLCLVTAGAVPAMADATKVVTLGADLTDAQKSTIMKYFNVDSSQVQILTVTNQDERDRLSAYVPLEQIGTRTVSCAYVKPTQSGGIKVRTANLNWVTCNMIASTLSTSGVTNCEVVAACPFEVSGTGALTGILMAYETASGETLDETKKELATEEMVVTGNLAEEVGQDDATSIINQAKMQIIQNNIQDADEIYNIVVNIAQQNNVSMDSSQLDTIVSLLQQIAQQQYDYSQMQETLENIENYLSGQTQNTTSTDESQDSIVDNLDESILGSDVIASSTEDPTLEEETKNSTENNSESWDYVEENTNSETSSTESGDNEQLLPVPENYGEETDSTEEIQTVPEETTSETVAAEENTEDELNTDNLTDEAKELFDKAETFCKGEYEGDSESLYTAMGDDAQVTVYLETETAEKLSKKVLKTYLDVLEKVQNEGEAAYTADGTETYLTTELNMLDKELKKLFGQDTGEVSEETTEEDILAWVAAEDKETLYKDTMKFFASLYNEGTETYSEEASYTEETNDSEESYAEDESYSEEEYNYDEEYYEE